MDGAETQASTGMEPEVHPHHGIDYMELSVAAPDLEKVEEFYSAVFGWRFNKYGPKYMGFIDNARGNQEAGGFELVEALTACSTGPLVILYSEDLEASREAVLASSGLVTKDIYDFPGGRCFEFKDPFGTALSCWSPPSGAPCLVHRVHHAIDQIELSAANFAQTEAFFAAAFGWRFNRYGPKYIGYVDGAKGEAEHGGFVLADRVDTGGPLVVIFSDSLEKSFEAVTEAGGDLTKDIFEFPGGRRFEFKDPSGNAFACWGRSLS
eukprot:TRINITY_DN84290_c0_g1_i1.p1 TRINITY_DN84290_c0_g1~~TRINITY_DN84290_c0_g1_i1.p1  ORF type:complete len:265 (+),score=51.44 TRINITY_DN84290_c0_g1_i1:150-944(+)